jgi:GNAT superfamily N-acetyltransferase
VVHSFSVTATETVDEATQQIIGEGLDRFNEARVGPDRSRPAWVIARDEAGKVIGGLKGVSVWTWFLIDWLWVDEAARGCGVGSELIKAGEDIARTRGCRHAYLYTFSFQAPDFYRKLGYGEFARQDDFPPGHSRHWLRKDLAGKG